ncbi:unnamed protein product [Clavelina lepadiformis]|uniref:Protein sprouty n=1 Tax=Clavelina lepadiformis TaxID=159417 RepID=A0ABP0FWU7_CLALP
MLRPRTLSAAARSDTTTVDSPLLVLSNSSRNRAVDNDYFEAPSSFRPSSAPLITSIPARNRDPPRENDRLVGRETNHSAERRSRHHPSKRRDGDRNRCRRHLMPLPVPTSAPVVFPCSASLPSSLITRNSSSIVQTSLGSRPAPVVPPRIYPQTVGHLPPRSRGLSEDLSRKLPPPLVSEEVAFHPTDSSAPPPRPPRPSAEVAARLGLVPRDNHDDNVVATLSVRTTQPRRMSAEPTLSTTVVSQPRSMSFSSNRVTDSTSNKKSLIVELKNSSTTTQSTTKSDTRKMSTTKKNDSSLKKNSDSGSILHSSSNDDHDLIGPDGNANSKPGEHNYPCPRCGKCMCPRCRGETTSSSAPPRWACNNRCFYNADSCVEAATCLCCVRGCFYHCSNYEDDGSCTDKPCSCRGSNWCCRWSAIGAMSLVLPCLLCYPVARGCLNMCRACAKCIKPGCRCKESYR